MQLKKHRHGQLVRALGMLTANLFAATGAHAQTAPAPQSYADTSPPRDAASVNDDTQTDANLTRVDSAVLFYQEAGGRVRTIEPVVSATMNSSTGDALSVRLTSDTLTGATPNGAAPSRLSQTFITPAHAPGTSTVVTGASGGSTIVTIPGTGTVARQYITAPNQLPVDSGFRDQRYAIDLGYVDQWDADTRLNLGGSASVERDYTSFTLGFGAARDFNQKNTTASAGLNFEFDQSRPYFGTPQPLTVMSATPKGANQTKVVSSVVLGVTQVMSRRWIAQLSYNIGATDGYQTDPYRIISVVDSISGDPVQYLYESRPKTRIRQSVYLGNKIAFGPTVTDLSARYYHDSWGVNSVTAAIAERIALTRWLYIEPQARYYSQNAANFFHDYLINSQPTPGFATSDSRLGKFKAITLGAKIGLKVGHTGELYLQGENYRQTGDSHPAGAVGAMAKENLFTGVNASSVIVGYTFAFY